MNKQDLRIVYMGTPDFAVPTLDALVQGGYNVVGVITMPDKPAGRGHKLQYSPVKEYALAHQLPLLQPEKLKNEDFLAELKSWNADLQIVVAFRMLPEVVWNMPRCGTFNLHAALLPQYRGAAPINWAVMNGDTKTGATTFFLDHDIDTGRIILKEEMDIAPDENVGSVHDRLMEMGKGLVCRTVDLVLEADGNINRIPTIDQQTLMNDLVAATGIAELRPAPKIFKETCHIDWTATAQSIYNKVRGLSPYPAAWTELTLSNGEILSPVKIYRVSMLPESGNNKHSDNNLNNQSNPVPSKGLEPGKMETDGKNYIHIGCADGTIALEELQLPGKKRMDVKALLNGVKL
ncbi:MAG: methionyl-tRNA formyltransferase [Bacteroidales bacterium]|nr:methionyl-tRNA formyltransferase [Bacteroidales bacterium]MBP5764106.1 methionyl-tRNA formyltransferase [Bacteroidales bacterium]